MPPDTHYDTLPRKVGLCMCARWVQPYSVHRRYCQLPVSGRNMKRFRPGCHKLPIATDRRAGVVRASSCRHYTFCSAGALGDERYLVFECVCLAGCIAGQVC